MTDEQKELLSHIEDIVSGAYEYNTTLTVHEMEDILDDITAIQDIDKRREVLV
jgi:hypothetical protein